MLEEVAAGLLVTMYEVERGGGGERPGGIGLCDGSEQLGVKAPANHCGSLQERSVALREPIDAGAEQRLHARRQCRSERGGVEVNPARLASDKAALEEKTHDLLREQRVSLRLRRDQPRQLLGKFIGAEPRLYDARGLSVRERLE